MKKRKPVWVCRNDVVVSISTQKPGRALSGQWLPRGPWINLHVEDADMLGIVLERHECKRVRITVEES